MGSPASSVDPHPHWWAPQTSRLAPQERQGAKAPEPLAPPRPPEQPASKVEQAQSAHSPGTGKLVLPPERAQELKRELAAKPHPEPARLPAQLRKRLGGAGNSSLLGRGIRPGGAAGSPAAPAFPAEVFLPDAAPARIAHIVGGKAS